MGRKDESLGHGIRLLASEAIREPYFPVVTFCHHFIATPRLQLLFSNAIKQGSHPEDPESMNDNKTLLARRALSLRRS